MSKKTRFSQSVKVSPTVLSVASLPFVTLWIISGIVYNLYQAKGDMDAIPGFWLGIFLVGGPLAAAVAGGVVAIRLSERQKFSRLDKVTVALAVIGAVICAGSLTYGYVQVTQASS